MYQNSKYIVRKQYEAKSRIQLCTNMWVKAKVLGLLMTASIQSQTFSILNYRAQKEVKNFVDSLKLL